MQCEIPQSLTRNPPSHCDPPLASELSFSVVSQRGPLPPGCQSRSGSFPTTSHDFLGFQGFLEEEEAPALKSNSSPLAAFQRRMLAAVDSAAYLDFLLRLASLRQFRRPLYARFPRVDIVACWLPYPLRSSYLQNPPLSHFDRGVLLGVLRGLPQPPPR